MSLEIIILAAGQGKRMLSQKPKALHLLGGRPLLEHVLTIVSRLDPAKIHVVVGFGAEKIKAQFHDIPVNWVEQPQPRGSGDAVLCAVQHISDGVQVLSLNVDVPLIAVDTLEACIKSATGSMALVTAIVSDASGLGRIVRDSNQEVAAIIEERDANDQQMSIQEINTGVLCSSSTLLRTLLVEITPNNEQSEYYLTDVIQLARDREVPVKAVLASNKEESLGVNDHHQLAILERAYQRQKAAQLLDAGATIIDPNRIDIRGDIAVGMDCLIDVNVVFEGQVVLEDRVIVGSGCCLKNVRIRNDSEIKSHCVLEDAIIGGNCRIGPFARIRPGTELANNVSVGNFVEVKNAKLKEGVKANHLAYIGDASVGSGANIGAGSITCNYDGSPVKHHTIIGDRVFVGTNATLVAPLEIGNDAFIAAGSIITRRVPSSKLVVGRARQRVVKRWTPPSKR